MEIVTTVINPVNNEEVEITLTANDSRYLEWLEEGNIPEPWSPEAV